ncbi:putative PEP-binding protein [Calothrix sp. 336/3]|uniref:putative PEP-binding protein n=1 Tax=Calothrix sp. 336/3 TaxID=1337936 RepID=UPI0004E45874|nr:putative PEP-binding protein [Calothrix sp. 336/3]AKG23476.1 phosphoenolpyruvate synthase [Calothrix sp. 336/3]
MKRLYWLDEIQSQNRADVGDQAFYLGKIKQRGYPVLPGFVISATVLREFLETLNSTEALVADLPYSSLHLDVGNWRQLQQVAGRLRQEIITAPLPEDFLEDIFTAARSWDNECLIFHPTLIVPGKSAASVEGLMEAQVCCCQPEAIAMTLKQTWSQLFRARSLLYWQQAGVDLQKIKLAVLVQPLGKAIASGIFNGNTADWEIQSTWGLGMAITTGEVLPDVYYVKPLTTQVFEQQLGSKILEYSVKEKYHPLPELSAPQFLLTVEQNCLQVELIDETKQQEYALPEIHLHNLIALGNRFAQQVSHHFTWEWTIRQDDSSGTLYITQVSAFTGINLNSHFLKGLGAATGIITATAHVLYSKPEEIPPGVILIAPAIAPDWLPILQQAGGIVTEQGGLTSHGAILARELRIPAVVSISNVTNLIQHGEQLLIDGEKGEVYRLSMMGEGEKPQKADIEDNLSLAPVAPQISDPHPSPDIFPSSQLPIIATELLVNLSQANLIAQVAKLPVDGIGLLRSELMALTILEGKHPQVWINEGKQAELLTRWCEHLSQFVRAFTPRPIFYRSLDWRSPELSSFHKNLPIASLSILGDRGTYSYMKNPAVFNLELAAIAAVQKAGYENIRLLLPFVRTVEEFSFCRQQVEQVKLTASKHFQLWIMAEVPSVLFLLDKYVKAGVQGISIGTNDLTQLLLGVDREQGELAQAFDEKHPVIMDAIAQLIRMARDNHIPCSICGQAPALYPEIIQRLIELGINSISVEPEAVIRTYQAIARAESRILLANARNQF